ncbi:MAG: hypothetical protein A2X48_12810 [Lentisphaerae bacterium GWF2_49_21]|nr:MAG: hypothetical protein A2X48_12810 [Lentisphaerae bacterium GWF2_49_21]
MYYRLKSRTRLYRITETGVTWPTPVLGLGAFFTKGGRYNNPFQATVYCAEDPLAVIAEAAFYSALNWQAKISKHTYNPVTYPLVSNYKLWCFSITPLPVIIDLEHSRTRSLFQYSQQMLLNPSLNPADTLHKRGEPLERDYWGTQHIADDIRKYMPPGRRIEGIKAPAIRLKRQPNYRAHQLALFVFPTDPYDSRSTRIMECELKIRFLQSKPRQLVTSSTADIDWHKPQFSICGTGASTIPAYPGNPRSSDKLPNRWYNISIQFA